MRWMDETDELDKIDGFDAKGSTQVCTGADVPQDQIRVPGSNMSLRMSIDAHVCTALCKHDGTNVSHLRVFAQGCLYTRLMPVHMSIPSVCLWLQVSLHMSRMCARSLHISVSSMPYLHTLDCLTAP